MSDVNIRQRERKERLKNMVNLAIAYVKETNNDYSLPISIQDFGARFRVFHGVGEYASKRYFDDFVTIGVFIVKDGSFTVTIDKKTQDMIARLYDVSFPVVPIAKKSGKR
jgi:hypothetical protein